MAGRQGRTILCVDIYQSSKRKQTEIEVLFNKENILGIKEVRVLHRALQ